MDEVLERLLKLLKDYMPIYELVLCHYDFQRNCLEKLGYANISVDKNRDVFPNYFYVENGIEYVENVFSWKEPVAIVNDWQEDALAKAYAVQTGITDKSYIGLRLSHVNERVGGLIATFRKKNVYNEEHKKLFKQIQEPMSLALSNSLRHKEVVEIKNRYLNDRRELTKKLSKDLADDVVGAGGGLKKVMENINKVASLDSSVLLLGETGVGKDVIARAIHNLSLRNDGPFIKIDCGTIPESLIESELFGHEKGAFTGADSQKTGSFELADGGTVFLDEIGELSPGAQVKLLRLIQNREFVRVGGHKVIRLNIRIICATHRNLHEMVSKGHFREDLWYRLNVFPIQIPPLRERKEDIPALVSHLIGKKSREMNIGRVPIPNNFELGVLASYDWPGNIRELENILERWLILGCGGVSFSAILNPAHHEKKEERFFSLGFEQMTSPDEIIPLDEINKRYIKAALGVCKNRVGGKDGIAVRLKIPRTTLRSRMKKLGL